MPEVVSGKFHGRLQQARGVWHVRAGAQDGQVL